MYIHIGQDVLINSNDIVGVFDIENTSTGKITKEFLNKLEQETNVVNVCQDLPKSFVVCKNKTESYVYITQISPITIRKRIENDEF